MRSFTWNCARTRCGNHSANHSYCWIMSSTVKASVVIVMRFSRRPSTQKQAFWRWPSEEKSRSKQWDQAWLPSVKNMLGAMVGSWCVSEQYRILYLAHSGNRKTSMLKTQLWDGRRVLIRRDVRDRISPSCFSFQGHQASKSHSCHASSVVFL